MERFGGNVPTIGEPGLLFKQNNASFNATKVVRKWLEGIEVYVLNSRHNPDLDHIEHLSFRLKKVIYQMSPEIEQEGGSGDVVWNATWEALGRARDPIEEDILDPQLNSVEGRVKAVIEADGWYLKYRKINLARLTSIDPM